MKLSIKKNIFNFKLISIIILFAHIVVAKNSNFIISGGASLNTNLYISDFSKIPGYKTCCPNYSSAIGFGYSFLAGIEYITNSDIFGLKYNVSLMTSYSNISAEYGEEEFISNVINSKDYTQAYSEHILDANIKAITIEPGITLGTDLDIPIFFKLGIVIGFPLNPTIRLEERLISPDYVAFDTAGNRVRGRQSGNLPVPSSYIIAPYIGAGCTLYKSGYFNVTSLIQFNYSLKSISNILDWNTHFVRAGFFVNYNIPTPSLQPPIIPPLPELPLPELPPTPGRIELALNVFKDNVKIESDDTVEVPVKVDEYRYKFSVIPVIFYKKNSVEYSDDYSNYLNNISDGLKVDKLLETKIDAVQLVIKYLKSNPTVSVKLIVYSLDDESDDISKQRLNEINAKIINAGIAASRIKTKEIINVANNYPIEQLRDENRKIAFEFSDNKNILIEEAVEKISQIDNLLFKIKPDIICDSKDYKFNGEITLDGNKISVLSNEPQSFNLKFDNKQDKPQLMAFTGVLSNDDNQAYTNIVKLTIKFKEIINTHNNLYSYQNAPRAEYQILGFCEFDKSQMYAVNYDVVDYVNSAIKSGKKIEILPLTDNIGTPEHNSQLAKARASNAIRILELSGKDIKVVYPENFLFSNDKPIGRMLNRSVICRIIDKKN